MGKAIVQIKGGKVGICKSMKGLKMERRRKGERGFFLKKKVEHCIWAYGRVSILKGLGLEVYLCLWLVGWSM